MGCSKSRKIKVSGSALAAEICAGPQNRLLRRQHCSSLCSQSEGHEHVANMTNAFGHEFVGFSARAWPPQYSSPSLCKQSELQCFAPVLRRTLLFSKKKADFFEIIKHPTLHPQNCSNYFFTITYHYTNAQAHNPVKENVL